MDTGAITHNFIDDVLVKRLNLIKHNLSRSIAVTSIHQTTTVYHYVSIAVRIYDSQVKGASIWLPATPFLVLPSTPLPIIIGFHTMATYRLHQVFDNFFSTAADPIASASELMLLTHSPGGHGSAMKGGGKDASPRPDSDDITDPKFEIHREGVTYEVRDKAHFFGQLPAPNPLDELAQDPRDPLWEAAFSETPCHLSTGTLQAPEADVSQLFHVFGTDEEKAKLLALLSEFLDVFATELPSEPCDCRPIDIQIDEDMWIKHTRNKQYCRPQTPEKNAAICTMIEGGTRNQLLVAAPTGLAGWSQVVLVPKKQVGEWRT
jgi:hypothetical protein